MTLDVSQSFCFTVNTNTGEAFTATDGGYAVYGCPYGSYVSMTYSQFAAWIAASGCDNNGLCSFSGSSGSSGGTTTTTPQFTADEVTALKYQAANPSPFVLSMSDGGLISGAVSLVWISGWAIRQLTRALNTDGEKE